METESILGIIGVATGGFGLLLAGIANGKAKTSNEIAEKANGVAADALREARVANKIAHASNELAEESNLIAQRQAENQADLSGVRWRGNWSPEKNAIVLTNTGTNNAYNVSVAVAADTFHEAQDLGINEIKPGGKFLVRLPQVVQRRKEHVSKFTMVLQDRVPLVIDCEVMINWATFNADKKSTTINCKLRVID